MPGTLHAAPIDDDDTTRTHWQKLAEQCGQPFATPEWIDAWWAGMGRPDQRQLYGCFDAGGELVALAPMALGRVGSVPVLRFAGYGPADLLGPVCHPVWASAALAALQGMAGRWTLFLAERTSIAVGAPDDNLVELRRESSPVIDLSSGWDEYLSSRSSNLRSQIRRKERNLVRDHELAFRLSDSSRFADDMDTLLRLHAARWAGGGSQAFGGPRAAFHRAFAGAALEQGWLRLWIAEVSGGRPVAAWYGLRFGGEEWYYQSGRDPHWDRSSVGLVLLAHTIRSAAADGVRRYRLLRGGEAYKDRFATSDEPVATLAGAGTTVGRATLRLAVAASRRQSGRRLLGRIAKAN